MNIRHFVLAAVLSALCNVAGAQGFSSVSGPPPPQRATVPSAAAPALVVAGTPATEPAAQAFSSVSTPPSVATNAGAAAGAGPLLPFSGTGPSSAFEIADRIVIEKGARRLRLLRGGNVIGEYPVKLGLNPYGHKQREGDFRTPEGTYHLSRRNPRSEFFLSVEVSYPNADDRARARQAGAPPGGLITIHGQPNVPRKTPDYYASNDWTDGCIAVSNSDMVDIWLRTTLGTTIEIRP
jgi:lipoprotein-anchoring transpeptidase ErfK/SrfK